MERRGWKAKGKGLNGKEKVWTCMKGRGMKGKGSRERVRKQMARSRCDKGMGRKERVRAREEEE